MLRRKHQTGLVLQSVLEFEMFLSGLKHHTEGSGSVRKPNLPDLGVKIRSKNGQLNPELRIYLTSLQVSVNLSFETNL